MDEVNSYFLAHNNFLQIFIHAIALLKIRKMFIYEKILSKSAFIGCEENYQLKVFHSFSTSQDHVF